MANVIKLKRGSGSDPSASDLVVGEVAIRTDSGKLFTKKDNGTIAEISGSGGGSDIFINTLSSSSGSGGGSATFNGTATRFTLSNPPSVSAQQLLVSINGVVQKPNSGTSPSEGFAIDGNDIIFAAAPATGSDFFIVTYGSLNIAVPADNSVTSAKIVDGTIVGTDLATNIDLVDNQKIRFGTGNDLQIYHDGTFNYIVAPNNHEVHINANSGGSTENMAKFKPNNAVELYYDNVKRIETASAGANIVGNLDLINGHVYINDNYKVNVGTSSDLQIYHDGTHSRLNSATGMFNIQSDDFRVTDAANSLTAFKIDPDGATDLRYNGSVKLQTTTAGVALSGNLELTGPGSNVSTSFDNAAWEKVVFDGSYSATANGPNKIIIQNDTTGGGWYAGFGISSNEVGYYSGGNHVFYTDKTNTNQEIGLKIIEHGSVELYYDNSKKFETTSYGAKFTDNVLFNNPDTAGRNLTWEADNDSLHWEDNTKATFGGGNDLQIYHDGVNRIVGSGNLIFQSPDIFFKSLDGNTTFASIDSTGKIDLNASVAKFGNSHSTGTTYLFGHDIRFTNAGITTTTMIIDSSAGNVGIGTTPSYRLDARKDSTTAYSASASPSNVIARIQNGSAQTNSHSSLLLTATNDNGAVDFWWMTCVSQSTNYDGFLAFSARTTSSASQELVRFANNGRVSMQVLALGSGNSHNSAKLVIQGAGNDSYSNTVFVKNSDETQLFSLRSDGVFYTGVDGASPYNLTTSSAANMVVSSTGAVRRSTSSVRYKKDIADATFGLADVLKLKPKTFKNNATGEFADDKTHAGFTAEDIHDLGLTEFVQYNEANEPDALAYGNMVALMAKAIQELNAKVEALEAG